MFHIFLVGSMMFSPSPVNEEGSLKIQLSDLVYFAGITVCYHMVAVLISGIGIQESGVRIQHADFITFYSDFWLLHAELAGSKPLVKIILCIIAAAGKMICRWDMYHILGAVTK